VNSTAQLSPSQASTSVTTILSSTTLTSYSTYSVGVTQSTSTASNSVYNGNIPLMGWGEAGCLSAGFPFNANPGDQLTVNFNSNIPIDFYLMSAGQFQRVPPATSLCVLGFIPVIPSQVSASYRTSYSLTWSPTLPGQYYIVLMNLQPATASVFLSASVTSVQATQVVVNATTTTTMTSVYSQVSSMLVAAANTTTTSQAMSAGLSTQTIQWIAVVVVLAAIGVIFALSRKRSVKAG